LALVEKEKEKARTRSTTTSSINIIKEVVGVIKEEVVGKERALKKKKKAAWASCFGEAWP